MADSRDKPSWSQRDKRNSKSSYGTNPKADKRSTDLAKQQLEALFTPVQDPKQSKALKELATLDGKDFAQAASTYVESYGFPDQAQDLLCFFDSDDAEFLLALFAHIDDHCAQWSNNGKRIIKGQIEVNQIMFDDQRCIDASQALTKKLS